MLSYPPSVRNPLLEDLFSQLRQALPHDPRAIELQATHLLGEDEAWVETPDFVDQLRQANDILVEGVKDVNVNRDEMGAIYAEWVESWTEKLQDENLVCKRLDSDTTDWRLTVGLFFTCSACTSSERYNISSLASLRHVCHPHSPWPTSDSANRAAPQNREQR